MKRCTYYDLIDPAIRCGRLLVKSEHRACIVATMRALPDANSRVVAAKCLIRLYGKPWTPREQRPS